MDRGSLAHVRISTGATTRVMLGEAPPFLRASYHASMSSCRRRLSPHHAQQESMQSRAQAHAIPWDDAYASEMNLDTAEPQPAPLPKQRQFAVTQRASKPLKINMDLLLVCLCPISQDFGVTWQPMDPECSIPRTGPAFGRTYHDVCHCYAVSSTSGPPKSISTANSYHAVRGDAHVRENTAQVLGNGRC